MLTFRSRVISSQFSLSNSMTTDQKKSLRVQMLICFFVLSARRVGLLKVEVQSQLSSKDST